MATWGMLRNDVDSYLARLTPEALAVVRQWQKTGDTTLAERVNQILTHQLGLSDSAARNLRDASYFVYSKPDQKIDDNVFLAHEKGGPGMADTYTNQDAYRSALLDRMGLGDASKNALAASQGAGGSDGGVDPVLARRKAINSELDRFYALMMTPVVNPDGTTSDPIAKQLIASGQNVAQREAANRGIGGPMAGTAAMASAQTALQPYLADRLKMAQQGLQSIVERDNVEEDQRLKADQLALQAQGMANDNAATAYNAKVKQGQGLGTLIGTGVGMLGYAIPGAGAAVGPLTSAAGGALGGYIGGSAAGQGGGPTLSVPRFTNTSGRNPGRGNY